MYPGKFRVCVSLNRTIEQFIQSSSIGISQKLVRDCIDLIATLVPWFCRIVKLNRDGCLSSQSTITINTKVKDEEDAGKEGGEEEEGMQKNKGKENGRTGLEIGVSFRGKENNGNGKAVEGILIFAKREGKFIGREEILKEFRLKKLEWQNKNKK